MDERIKKEELLEHLGNAYFRSGMLQRSKEIYLKILNFSPRNQTALKHLLLIFQSLKDYEKAEEILDVLDELEVNVIKEKIYINVLKTINDPLLSFETKSVQLYNNYTINKSLQRIVADFLVKFNKKLFWENIEKFEPKRIIDLLWYFDFDDIDFDKVQKDDYLQEVYSAKGYIDSKKSSNTFELAILISVRNSDSKVDVDLNFEFICGKCKKTHPIYESRCPHCHEILTFNVIPRLSKSISNMGSLV